MSKAKRVDTAKDKRIRNVEKVVIVDKKTIAITVRNQTTPIIIEARAEDYGYDAGLYIMKG